MNEYIQTSLSFDEYVELLNRLLSEGKTTGRDQSESRVGYGRLNMARMRRLEKTIELDEAVKLQVAGLDVDWIWLVITEAWCGDAAQNIPVVEKFAAANRGIETRYILRDENPELIDRFLTNGTRSIPKLIAIDRNSGGILGTWGPRPKAAQNLFAEQKALGMDKPVIHENIQRWYLDDRGRSLQLEIAELVKGWLRTPLANAA
jgi:hypothetical protein